MALKDVTQIVYNKQDMFKHYIELRRADDSLEAKIPCLPDESAKMFADVLEKWNKMRELKRKDNGTVS